MITAPAILLVICALLGPDAQANIYDCEDFTSQAQAQAVLDVNPSDPHWLDADDNGIACETYPYPPSAPPYYEPNAEPSEAEIATVEARAEEQLAEYRATRQVEEAGSIYEAQATEDAQYDEDLRTEWEVERYLDRQREEEAASDPNPITWWFGGTILLFIVGAAFLVVFIPFHLLYHGIKRFIGWFPGWIRGD